MGGRKALANMYGEGRMVELAYLCEGLKSIPELKQAPLEKILLDGIRKHAQDGNSPLRFWARFIVELGRQRNDSGTLIERDGRSDGTVTYKWDPQRCDTYNATPTKTSLSGAIDLRTARYRCVTPGLNKTAVCSAVLT